VPQERPEIDAAQTKSATTAKVAAPAASKPKLKLAKVRCLAKLLNYFLIRQVCVHCQRLISHI